MSNQPDQHTYLLRLWQSDDGSWRILLHEPTGKRPEGFTTISDLCAHLKVVTSETVAETPRHRFAVDDDQVQDASVRDSIDSDFG